MKGTNFPKLTPNLASIVANVRQKTGYDFGVCEIAEVLAFTKRKCKINGKSDDYVPILFETELEDYLRRECISFVSSRNWSRVKAI